MSIRHFRIFIAVAEEENITKAAKKLYLTQPTVSIAIKEIEEHYGARFFERINQRLHITEEGKRFLDYAKHFIAMYDEMEIAFIKSVYLIATRDLSNLWLQFFLSQNQGFMRLFEKTVLK